MSGTVSNDQEKMWDVYRDGQPTSDEPALVIDVDGFEGPLDLLLTLARNQKVDLTRISILALAEQYLDFVERVRERRLELAADYLVMAAWLAFLKSRLLLPDTSEEDEPSGEELAAELAFRLRRLEAMRDVAARLANRDRLGRDVFARGDPEPIHIQRHNAFSATLYDLLSAYAEQRQRHAVVTVHVRARDVWSLQDAREALSRLVPESGVWAPLDTILEPYLASSPMRRSIRASALGASLEMVREGKVELRQAAPFEALYMRGRPDVKREADHG
ncbi:MAG: segregation and condensation protein A [Alphaproteobacteria bacterium]